MGIKKMVVLEQSFVNDTLAHPGQIVYVDEKNLNGDEKNLADAEGFPAPATVEIAAIAPTGPNPTMPQQLPPDALQTAAGTYVQPGAELVAEITAPGEVRSAGRTEADSTAQEDIANLMSEARGAAAGDQNNDDDALVAGTVADVTANLGAKTDEELTALRAAEVDREKPRKGVISAIDAEVAARAEA
jgi:hypothetical protein